DEPLSNLDAKLRVDMRTEIKKLHQKLGTTIVYVTHDQIEAMTLADRLIVLNKGQAEQIGTPMELYSNPASLFVAGFVGTPAMNLLPGRMENNGISFKDGGHLALPQALVDKAKVPEVTLGLRPEHLRLVQQKDDTPNALNLSVKVDLIEHLGADTLLHTRPEEGGPTFTLRYPGEAALPSDDRLTLTADADKLRLFDTVSGARL
ncbi:MAG TPA: sn-glycerol-3-phosphate ABC transporter ATP-binding protein UgpC, partial [Rhodospirillaceae bacterium]|nr:sn-glycerol-3-phosphate ABC transporter ATP-binding protein UgpC [Rhodospirillaceae bacterium]